MRTHIEEAPIEAPELKFRANTQNTLKRVRIISQPASAGFLVLDAEFIQWR
jgi:hypothetical protein